MTNADRAKTGKAQTRKEEDESKGKVTWTGNGVLQAEAHGAQSTVHVTQTKTKTGENERNATWPGDGVPQAEAHVAQSKAHVAQITAKVAVGEGKAKQTQTREK